MYLRGQSFRIKRGSSVQIQVLEPRQTWPTPPSRKDHSVWYRSARSRIWFVINRCLVPLNRRRSFESPGGLRTTGPNWSLVNQRHDTFSFHGPLIVPPDTLRMAAPPGPTYTTHGRTTRIPSFVFNDNEANEKYRESAKCANKQTLRPIVHQLAKKLVSRSRGDLAKKEEKRGGFFWLGFSFQIQIGPPLFHLIS